MRTVRRRITANLRLIVDGADGIFGRNVFGMAGDASRSSATLGNLLNTAAPNSLANRDIYRGISRFRPAFTSFLVAESEG